MSKPPIYIAYLLRLWQVEDRLESVWHASLEDPHTGERKGFADLESLWAFLREQINSEHRNITPDEAANRDMI
jgi:hypothetical protein